MPDLRDHLYGPTLLVNSTLVRVCGTLEVGVLPLVPRRRTAVTRLELKSDETITRFPFLTLVIVLAVSVIKKSFYQKVVTGPFREQEKCGGYGTEGPYAVNWSCVFGTKRGPRTRASFVSSAMRLRPETSMGMSQAS